MKKIEFEQALKNAPKESEMYFRFDDGHEMRILNCHREERDITSVAIERNNVILS